MKVLYYTYKVELDGKGVWQGGCTSYEMPFKLREIQKEVNAQDEKANVIFTNTHTFTLYPQRSDEKSAKKQQSNPYPKTDDSPSVCEILNRGD